MVNLAATLIRQKYSAGYTLGTLVYGINKCMVVLERPWLNNQRSISCIPEGTYDCAYLAKSASGKYTSVYHIQDVKDRSGILIHAGNFVSHTTGCLLPGLRKGTLQGNLAVLSSKRALAKLLTEFDKQDFTLTIRSI